MVGFLGGVDHLRYSNCGVLAQLLAHSSRRSIDRSGRSNDKLLSRFEAVADGRSPKGAYSTPSRLIGSILADELASGGPSKKKESPPSVSLSAIPPGFRDYAEKLNMEAMLAPGNDDYDDSSDSTSSGIPLPFAGIRAVDKKVVAFPS